MRSGTRLAMTAWLLGLLVVLADGSDTGGSGEVTVSTETETGVNSSSTNTTGMSSVEWPTDSMEPPSGVCPGQAKVVAEIVGFIVLFGTSIYIGLFNSYYQGHSGREANFCGHEEQTMLSWFVNLYASMSYFARIVANGSCQSGFVIYTSIRYFDYILACPLLILDLLWNLESPYKWTCSGLVLVSIVMSVAAFTAPAPASYAWFAGGCFIFALAYVSIVYLVMERLKHFAMVASSDSQNQAAIGFLKISAVCFFFVWIWYPLVYVLSPKMLRIITGEQQDVIHVVLDVLAKSVYGLVSLSFRFRFDKSFLRGITEEEYVEFSKRSPQRRSIRMQIRLGAEEEEAMRMGISPGLTVQVPFDEGREPALGGGGMGISRQLAVSNSSGLAQPAGRATGETSRPGSRLGGADEGRQFLKPAPVAPGGSARNLRLAGQNSTMSWMEPRSGSRLLFPSDSDGDGRQTVMFGGRDFGSALAADDVEGAGGEGGAPLPGWLADLAAHLHHQVGLRRAGGVDRVVEQLRGAGVGLDELAGSEAEAHLRRAEVTLGARRAILSYYHGGGGGPAGAAAAAAAAAAGSDLESGAGGVVAAA